MYNIFELKSKTLPELKEIAAQLGIQVNNNTQAEDLVYTILDEQAISASKISAQNGEGKKKKKRTRPAKNDETKTDETPAQEEKEENTTSDSSENIPAETPADNNDSEKAAAAPRKNKPGRKKKQAQPEAAPNDLAPESEPAVLPASHPALLESVDELFSSIHAEPDNVPQNDNTETAVPEQEPAQAPAPKNNGKAGKKQAAKKGYKAAILDEEPFVPAAEENQPVEEQPYDLQN